MNFKYYDEDYPQTNRDKSHAPKKGNTYCGGCDMALVPDGGKCHLCGWKDGKKRLKP